MIAITGATEQLGRLVSAPLQGVEKLLLIAASEVGKRAAQYRTVVEPTESEVR